MFQRSNHWLAVLAILFLGLTPAPTDAKKPDKPGGGGGSGFVMVPLVDSSGSLNEIGYAEGLHELRDEAGELVGMEVVGISAGDAQFLEPMSMRGPRMSMMRVPLSGRFRIKRIAGSSLGMARIYLPRMRRHCGSATFLSSPQPRSTSMATSAENTAPMARRLTC